MFNSKKKKTQKNKTNAMQFPQTNAESIPYKKVYKNGIFEIEDGVYSKTYKLPPLNFKTASTDTQQRIAEAWSVFLGSLPDDVTREITIYNQTIDIMRFQENIMIPMKADSLNGYRAEYNNMLLEKMSGAKNNLEAVKFITLSLPADDIEKATERFTQIDHNVIDQVSQITKNAPTILSYLDRLELINAIYNQDSTTPLYQKRVFQGQEVESFSLENCKAQGINTKDVIAPSAITFERDYVKETVEEANKEDILEGQQPMYAYDDDFAPTIENLSEDEQDMIAHLESGFTEQEYAGIKENEIAEMEAFMDQQEQAYSNPEYEDER